MEAIRRSRLNSARSSGRASLPEKPKSNCLVGCVGNYFEKFFNFFQTPVIKFSYHAVRVPFGIIFVFDIWFYA